MKKFKGTKRLIDILQQCKEQGVHINRRLFDQGKSDYIVLGRRGGGHVFFNTFNGTFFGTTPEGAQFTSRETTYENAPWFQALLSFFYIEDDMSGGFGDGAWF